MPRLAAFKTSSEVRTYHVGAFTFILEPLAFLSVWGDAPTEPCTCPPSFPLVQRPLRIPPRAGRAWGYSSHSLCSPPEAKPPPEPLPFCFVLWPDSWWAPTWFQLWALGSSRTPMHEGPCSLLHSPRTALSLLADTSGQVKGPCAWLPVFPMDPRSPRSGGCPPVPAEMPQPLHEEACSFRANGLCHLCTCGSLATLRDSVHPGSFCPQLRWLPALLLSSLSSSTTRKTWLGAEVNSRASS